MFWETVALDLPGFSGISSYLSRGDMGMRIILGVALVFGWCSLAVAADIDIVAHDKDARAAVITIKGRITAGENYYFDTLAAGIDKAVVMLESPGGDMLAATRIGQSIRAKGFGTAVADRGLCASACAMIWLAGTARLLGRDARVGFHSSAKNMKRSDISNTHVRPYVEQLGYPSELYSYIIRADPSTMTWLTQQDSIRYEINPTPLGTLGVPR
jgi:hypothetical protein